MYNKRTSVTFLVFSSYVTIYPILVLVTEGRFFCYMLHVHKNPLLQRRRFVQFVGNGTVDKIIYRSAGSSHESRYPRMKFR